MAIFVRTFSESPGHCNGFAKDDRVRTALFAAMPTGVSVAPGAPRYRRRALHHQAGHRNSDERQQSRHAHWPPDPQRRERNENCQRLGYQ